MQQPSDSLPSLIRVDNIWNSLRLAYITARAWFIAIVMLTVVLQCQLTVVLNNFGVVFLTIGGSATGAVFNPALAFSTQFSCSGNTFAEYSLVYWLGPVLGEGLLSSSSSIRLCNAYPE